MYTSDVRNDFRVLPRETERGISPPERVSQQQKNYLTGEVGSSHK